MGRAKKNTGRNTRQYIQISDGNKWDLIDQLRELDKYKKSFSKVINDALDFGLPELVRRELDKEVSLPNVSQEAKSPTQIISEKFFEELSRLLKENIANSITIKGLLASLFKVKAMELKGDTPQSSKFEGGSYKDTPQVFAENEKRILEQIRR